MPTDPPPANWLRGAGLVAFLALVAADVFDGKLDGGLWSYLVGLALIVWGPAVLIQAARKP